MALIEEAMCDYYAQIEAPVATEEGYTRLREIRENKKPPGRAESFPFMTTEKVLRNKSMTGRQGKYRKRIRCLLRKHHSYIKTLGLMLCR